MPFLTLLKLKMYKIHQYSSALIANGFKDPYRLPSLSFYSNFPALLFLENFVYTCKNQLLLRESSLRLKDSCSKYAFSFVTYLRNLKRKILSWLKNIAKSDLQTFLYKIIIISRSWKNCITKRFKYLEQKSSHNTFDFKTPLVLIRKQCNKILKTTEIRTHATCLRQRINMDQDRANIFQIYNFHNTVKDLLSHY